VVAAPRPVHIRGAPGTALDQAGSVKTPHSRFAHVKRRGT